MVKPMEQHHNELVIQEGQTIKSKVPNERVLYLGMSLGLLGRDKYEALKQIGESKPVSELVQELSSIELDILVDTMQALLKENFIALE
jgi:hypothetical protein